MRTGMHQDAFPGEDISDRPLPETVVPRLLRLLAQRPASGRYRPATSGRTVDGLLTETPARELRRRPPSRRGRPRRAASRGTRCGCWSVPPTGSSTPASDDLPDHLRAGDVLVVNTSATVAGRGRRGPARRRSSCCTSLRASTTASGSSSCARHPTQRRAVLDAQPRRRGPGRRCTPDPGRAVADRAGSSPTGAGNRLWRARVRGDLEHALDDHGRPDRLRLPRPALSARRPTRPSSATHPGSAEMASAGRPFTEALVTRLVSSGVTFAPVTLHTGLSSQEAGEAPGPEWFEVPAASARMVNAARARRRSRRRRRHHRDPRDRVGGARRAPSSPTRGWTSRVVTPADPPHVVDGLITGWHDPHASHLLLVEAVAGRRAHAGGVRRSGRPRLPLARVRRLGAAAARDSGGFSCPKHEGTLGTTWRSYRRTA